MKEDGETIEPIRWFGIEIYRYDFMAAYLWWRLRFLWYRLHEDWRWGITIDEDWQIELGPAVLVYIRTDDF